MKNLKIKRVEMSGRGARYTYKIVDAEGITMFKTSETAYFAWSRKKDAQRILDHIDTYGLEYVEEKLMQSYKESY